MKPSVTADAFDPGRWTWSTVGHRRHGPVDRRLVLQDVFRITIDEDDYPRLKSVGAIREYIRSNRRRLSNPMEPMQESCTFPVVDDPP